jgi:hypothetical protein
VYVQRTKLHGERNPSFLLISLLDDFCSARRSDGAKLDPQSGTVSGSGLLAAPGRGGRDLNF